MNGAWLLVVVAAITAYVAVEALRRRILFKMGVRNAVRRPKQTATVIAGLMIGTALISAALVAGDSAGSAIRGAVYDALGEVDETVRTEGFYYFPDQEIDDPFFDAVAPNAFWQGTASQGEWFEPQIQMIGFDPVRDRAFGDFELTDGSSDGTDLAPASVFITQDLADTLDVLPGDAFTIATTPPRDPLIPTWIQETGTVGLGFNPDALLGIPLPPVETDPVAHTLNVTPGAVQVTAIVACLQDPCEVPSLRATLTDPTGQQYQAVQAFDPQTMAPILWLNVTGQLPGGSWTVHVSGTLATQVPYAVAVIAVHPVYDVQELQRRAEAIEDLGDFQNFIDVDISGPRKEQNWTVAGITTGGRGDQFDFDNAVFMRLDDAQTFFERPGEVNLIKVSNPGDVRTGAASTEEATQRLSVILAGWQAEAPPSSAIHFIEIHPVKKELLGVADSAGELMTGLLVFASSLSILTGLLLIINIFTMLAEERRSELGMARAVGLTRRDLTRLFVFEGSLYAVVAAAIGTVLGLGLAYAMILVLNAILAGRSFPPIPFVPSFDALALAFSGGVILTFATIWISSRRQGKLNIVEAIRSTESNPRPPATWLRAAGVPLVVLGATLAVLGWVVDMVRRNDGDLLLFIPEFSFIVFGPMVLAIGMRLLLRGERPRVLDTILVSVLAAYYTVTLFVIKDFADLYEANVVGPIRGVAITIALVIIVTYWKIVPNVLGRLIRWNRAVMLPAMSYPHHKRFRTGMTLAMFALVILSIGFFSIFGALFESDPARQTGGYDIEAYPTLDVDIATVDAGLIPPGTFASAQVLQDHRSFNTSFITVEGERTGQFGPPEHHIYGIDNAFANDQNFALLWKDEAYATDIEVYEAVVRGEGTIVAYPYSTDEQGRDFAHKVGETVEVNLGQTTLNYTILGIQEQFHYQGIFLSKQEVNELFPQNREFLLYRVAPGVDVGETVRLLKANYQGAGLVAEDAQDEVRKEQESFRQLLGGMKLFLGLGLIIGVLSLGIVTSRSVLERRQEIGMMRALGYRRRQIRQIFLVEMTLTVIVGAVIGIAASILVTYGIWFALIKDTQYPYVIPWGEIWILLGISYAIAVLATLSPIRRAAKTAPAEALRYVE